MPDWATRADARARSPSELRRASRPAGPCSGQLCAASPAAGSPVDLDQAPVGEPRHEQLGQAAERRVVVERFAEHLARLGEQREPAPGERLGLVEVAVVDRQRDPARGEPDQLELVLSRTSAARPSRPGPRRGRGGRSEAARRACCGRRPPGARRSRSPTAPGRRTPSARSDSAIRPATPGAELARARSRPVCSKPSAARISSAVPVVSVSSTAAESVPSSVWRRSRTSGSRSSSSRCASAASVMRWRLPRDPGRLTRVVAAARRCRARAPPAGRCPRRRPAPGGRTARARGVPASSITPSTRPRAASGTYIAERMSSCFTISMCSGPRSRSSQHLLGEVRDHLGLAVDEHATDVRRLRIRRICARSCSASADLLGTGVRDGDPLEPPRASMTSITTRSASHAAAIRATLWRPA